MQSRTQRAAIRRAILPVLALPAAIAQAGQAAEVDRQRVRTDAPAEEIVVVAHKSGRSIRDVAATVSAFEGDEIRQELGNSLSDVFRYAPGIDFESAGTRFGAESVNLRGISGNRVAMLLDGVPLGDQFDVGNFSNATRDFVDAGFIERVEVLHGPASALYGSSAIGGVVTIRTPDADDLAAAGRSGGRFLTNWRSDNASLHATALQALGTGRLSAIAGASYKSGEEFDAAAAGPRLDRRDFAGRSALLKLEFEDALGNSLQAGYYHQRSDVASVLASGLGHGRFRSTTALAGDDEYASDMLRLEYRWSAGPVDSGVIRAYHLSSDVSQETRDERGAAARPVAIDRSFFFEQTARGVEVNLQKQVETGNAVHQLGFGVEYRHRRSEELRDAFELGLADGLGSKVLLGEVFPLRDFPVSRTVEWGAYVEDVLSVGRWTLIAALRVDTYDMRPRIDPTYEEDFPFIEPVSISEAELSPKLGLVFHPNDTTEFWLQYAHGFRAPPYEDANVSLDVPLFNYRAVPNPDLEPERSDGIEAGWRWRGAAAAAYLSVFRSEYEDFIESRVRLGVDPDSGRTLFQAQNVDRAVIEGLEAGASLKLDALLPGLEVETSLLVARGENRSSGDDLDSVGPAQAVVGLAWASPAERWRARWRSTITAAWSQRDRAGGELFRPEGHAVHDLYLARRLGGRLVLRTGILNLTNRSYWAWTDVRGIDPEDPVLPQLSRPGRAVTLGVHMHWQ